MESASAPWYGAKRQKCVDLDQNLGWDIPHAGRITRRNEGGREACT